jgi:hypothetical protein
MLLKLEAVLDARLKKDKKYDISLEFRKLTADNILLRYGDYYRGSVQELKKHALTMESEVADRKALVRMRWKQIF